MRIFEIGLKQYKHTAKAHMKTVWTVQYYSTVTVYIKTHTRLCLCSTYFHVSAVPVQNSMLNVSLDFSWIDWKAQDRCHT